MTDVSFASCQSHPDFYSESEGVCEAPVPEDSVCPPDDASTPEGPYDIHKLGRKVAPLATMIGGPVGSVGQYQFNYAVRQANPEDPVFQGWAGRLYETDSPATVMLPERMRGHPLSDDEIAELRQNGAKLQDWSGKPLKFQMGIRFAANVRAIVSGDILEDGRVDEREAAVLSDTGNVALHSAELHLTGKGLQAVSRGAEVQASRTLTRGHRVGLVGNSVQLVSGAVRLSIEWDNYADTGQLDNSAAIYASIDTAQGAAGVLYSATILIEAGRTASTASRVNVLSHLVSMGPVMKWSLRAAGGAGAVYGIYLNLRVYVEADSDLSLSVQQRDDIQTRSLMGMGGGVLMLISLAMVTTPLAPFAGFVGIAGLIVVVASDIY